MIRHVLPLTALGVALIALVSSWREGPATAPAVRVSGDAEVRALNARLERQERRIEELETMVSSLEDQVALLRPRGPGPTARGLPPTGIVHPTPQEVAAAVEPQVRAMAALSDGGVPPQLVTAVEQAMQAAREREEAERREVRARRQDQWLDTLETQLGLTLDQRNQLKGIVQWVDQRRTEFGRKMTEGEIPRSQFRTIFEENRREYDEKVRAVLTPEQAETWDNLDEMDRRPPFGPGFRRTMD